MTQELNRRAVLHRGLSLLAAAGTVGLSALAGCAGLEPVRAPAGGNPENERRILGLVLGARRSGLLYHHLGPALRPFAANGKLTLARTSEASPYDVVLGHAELLDTWLQQYHAPVEPGLVVLASDVDIQVTGSTARLGYTLKQMTSRWSLVQRETCQLWLGEAGWLVTEARHYPIERQEGRFVFQLSAFEWRRRDARVKEAREGGDPFALIDALREAHRFIEAHDELVAWAPRAEKSLAKPAAAAIWALRGQVAVEAGRARDALPSFRAALRLDDKVTLPPYKAAEDARRG